MSRLCFYFHNKPLMNQIFPLRTFSVSSFLALTPTATIPPRKRRRIPNRHWNPAFAKGRNWKVLKIDLPDFEWDRKRAEDKISPEEIKEKMKKMGIQPITHYQEKPLYISSVGEVLGNYVPPEGDGKASLMTTQKGGQVYDQVKGKGKTMSAVRKIRKYEEDFDVTEWVEEAMMIYREAHTALAEGDEDKMHKFVTEKAFPEMMNMAKRKTIRWNFIKSLEPAKVVHARCEKILSDENFFGQLTVRFHTQQTLAVYDRFGRLIHGSETVAKDVLEYVVFEKHLSNTYGTWRLHAKIIPDWMPAREPGRLTYKVPKDYQEKEKQDKEILEEEEETEEEGILDRFGRMIRKK